VRNPVSIRENIIILLSKQQETGFLYASVTNWVLGIGISLNWKARKQNAATHNS
jgi:hypothetical protein